MTGKRIVWPRAGEAELQEFEVPPPGRGEVLIGMEYSVLSAGTERACLMAKPNTPQTFPQYPGYCGIGRVVAVGGDVETVRAGERVLADHAGHCSLFVKPAAGLTVVDPAADPLEAAFTVIAAMSLQGVRKARIELGEAVLVEGLGLLGIFAVELAKLDGALTVIATDFEEKRRGLALALGADLVFSPDDPELAEKVKSATGGRGADAVIEVTGSAHALNQALECASFRGRVVLLGCTRISDEPVDFYRDVHRPGISIVGAHNFVRPKEDSSPGYWTYRDDFRTLLGWPPQSGFAPGRSFRRSSARRRLRRFTADWPNARIRRSASYLTGGSYDGTDQNRTDRHRPQPRFGEDEHAAPPLRPLRSGRRGGG